MTGGRVNDRATASIFAVRADDGPIVKRLQRDEDGWQLRTDDAPHSLVVPGPFERK